MQLDAAGEPRPGTRQLAHCGERVGVGRDVRLRDRDAAAVHAAVGHDAFVRRVGPSGARRHDVAVRVQRDRRPPRPRRAEALAHDQVGDALHPEALHQRLRNRVAQDGEPHRLEQLRRALRCGRVVARRHVGRHAHDLAQESDLLRMMRVDPAAERVTPVHRAPVLRGRRDAAERNARGNAAAPTSRPRHPRPSSPRRDGG